MLICAACTKACGLFVLSILLWPVICARVSLLHSELFDGSGTECFMRWVSVHWGCKQRKRLFLVSECKAHLQWVHYQGLWLKACHVVPCCRVFDACFQYCWESVRVCVCWVHSNLSECAVLCERGMPGRLGCKYITSAATLVCHMVSWYLVLVLLTAMAMNERASDGPVFSRFCTVWQPL